MALAEGTFFLHFRFDEIWDRPGVQNDPIQSEKLLQSGSILNLPAGVTGSFTRPA